MSSELTELLELTRENNAMLKEILGYVRMVQTAEYAEQRQMTSFLINVAADNFTEMQERMQQRNDNNQQTFWR